MLWFDAVKLSQNSIPGFLDPTNLVARIKTGHGALEKSCLEKLFYVDDMPTSIYSRADIDRVSKIV